MRDAGFVQVVEVGKAEVKRCCEDERGGWGVGK